MAKILVAYFSKTGNTKKIAEIIYKTIEGTKTLKPINEIENDDISRFELLYVGFPVYSHSVPYIVETFLKNLPSGKKMALFSTHGSLTGSRLSREALEYATILAVNTKILGTFSCRGKVSLQALEILQKSPEHKAWSEMAVSANTHPDENDLEDAGAFAKWIQTLAITD